MSAADEAHGRGGHCVLSAAGRRGLCGRVVKVNVAHVALRRREARAAAHEEL